MRILIVDDDPFAGAMAEAILDAEGHDCKLVESGVEALDALGEEHERFELVISDMHMPLSSGLDLFREMRDRGIPIPFVLLTGDDPEPLREQVPGLAACLTKDASLEVTLPAAVAGL
ncbi:response regulator [Thiocapsa marina]|uniref:Response regulator receiver protein n=1 Tax=Thiocapsa marina 5811 TaxID=768671 RepID=F9U749_9GAMM|nr:response regulator [Thiocapsa marina]EGV20075.1 response regulator receiver protein [Thiocapsa marina 5811]